MHYHPVPVALWILDKHPTYAPLCYVQPTSEMQINKSQYVDEKGKLSLPYLHEWDASTSNILGLIKALITNFEKEAPVSEKEEKIPVCCQKILLKFEQKEDSQDTLGATKNDVQSCLICRMPQKEGQQWAAIGKITTCSKFHH